MTSTGFPPCVRPSSTSNAPAEAKPYDEELLTRAAWSVRRPARAGIEIKFILVIC